MERIVKSAKLPTRAPGDLGADRMLELMAVDKKIKDGKLRLVLLNAIGEAELDGDFDTQALKETLEACRVAA